MLIISELIFFYFRTAGNLSSQPPVIPSSAPKISKKALKKTTIQKFQKSQVSESSKLEYVRHAM